MIPFVVILQRFLRALGLSLKVPEFQVLFFLVSVTLASGCCPTHQSRDGAI